VLTSCPGLNRGAVIAAGRDLSQARRSGVRFGVFIKSECDGTMANLIKIYCDTSAQLPNIRHSDPHTQAERAAVQRLKEAAAAGLLELYASLVNLREVSNTSDDNQRGALIGDHKRLSPILKDERLLGFNHLFDQFGGFINSPLISDTQDESIRDGLKAMGLSQKDAEHLTQAICNDCEYFLTRDKKTIMPYRDDIQAKHPPIRIRLPLELIEELETIGILTRRGALT
jgi:hypothetical protein